MKMSEPRSRGKYTLEFKQEAVRQVRAGRAVSVVAATLGMPKASLTNWVRADAKGQSGMTADGQNRTLYSLRHTYATLELLRGEVDIHTLRRQMGDSAAMIERHYSRLTATLAAERLA